MGRKIFKTFCLSVCVGDVPAGIYMNKKPKNLFDEMSREDLQEWAEAYDSKYQGFLEHGTLKACAARPGAKVISMATSTEYKVTNGLFKKHKVLFCVMGNQQKKGVLFQLEELYAGDEGSGSEAFHCDYGKAPSQSVEVRYKAGVPQGSHPAYWHRVSTKFEYFF